MGNTWPFVRTASPSAPVIDGSVGLPHSWHSPSPGSAHKTARSVRGRPSTCHYREEDHQKQLSWGPLVMQREVRNEEGWSVSAVAFQSAAASSAHCQDEGNSVPTPPPRLPADCGSCEWEVMQSPTQPCSATTVAKEHLGRFGLPVNRRGSLKASSYSRFCPRSLS